MNLLKKYIAKNKTGYFFSVLLAVMGVLAGLFAYVLLSKMIVALIAGNTDFAFYTKGVLSILALLCAKEVFMGISTTISHTATYGALCEIRRDIMDKLFKMPLGNILNLSTGFTSCLHVCTRLARFALGTGSSCDRNVFYGRPDEAHA